jgi:hypothetical protein
MTTGAAAAVHDAIERQGFAFVHSDEMADLLSSAGKLSDWNEFAASWNDLALDTCMADGGRYRRRRHAAYGTEADGPVLRKPHQPHYQSRDYNALNGGVERWFEPVVASVGGGETLGTILDCTRRFFESLTPGPGSATASAFAAAPADSPKPRRRRSGARRRWHVEVHQFRIEAREGQPGQPSPEGIHRDGVDYVLVLLINRVNVRSATTTVHALDGRTLGSFTLSAPLDAAFLDDRRVAHGVTAVEPLDEAQSAYRDVLVVTWAEEG